MKLVFAIISAVSLFVGCVPEMAHAQTTNTYYAKGDATISIAPTLSSTDLLDNHLGRTIGVSLEVTYWQTANTGTGVELGTYNLGHFSVLPIDHVTTTENLRVMPFQGKIGSRFVFIGTLGVEAYFIDGTKDVLLGAGVGYAFSQSWYLGLVGDIHIRPSGASQTIVARIVRKF